jgi:hypothetical protein
MLGPHARQNGGKKTRVSAHVDRKYYEPPSLDTGVEIDRVAKQVYTRKEAEGRYGFVLDRGGATPGNDVRVVEAQGVTQIIAGNKSATACSELSSSPATSPPSRTTRTCPWSGRSRPFSAAARATSRRTASASSPSRIDLRILPRSSRRSHGDLGQALTRGR